nr:uncharacterized protein LOC113819758 [Penaeus vannamei]
MAENVDANMVSVEEDLSESCIDDVRISGHPLPLPPAANVTKWGEVTTSNQLGRGCSGPRRLRQHHLYPASHMPRFLEARHLQLRPRTAPGGASLPRHGRVCLPALSPRGNLLQPPPWLPVPLRASSRGEQLPVDQSDPRLVPTHGTRGPGTPDAVGAAVGGPPRAPRPPAPLC